MQINTLTKPAYVLSFILMKCNKLLPVKFYLKFLFRLKMGYKLDLNNPRTFSEKLQWLKLYNRKPEYTQMVDKAAVKEYVSKIVGGKYIIPTLGIWESPEEIEWENLPNQFVLKTTHGGGSCGVVICKDKSSFDCDAAIKKLKKSMKQDIWSVLKEWPYKDVKPRIIAEQYLESQAGGGELADYKFYCFNGKVKYCETIIGRFTKKQIDFFDLNWEHQDFTFDGYDFAYDRPQRPGCFDKMIELANALCKDKPYSRIDLYVVGNDVYFGEITFFPASGLRGFKPFEWNTILGNLIDLPQKTE